MVDVVIVGGTHPNTLSMVRAMGMQGINVDVILFEKKEKDSYVLVSKYIEHSCVVQNAEEAVEILKKEYPDAITIVCSDDVAALLDEKTAYYMDKQRQVEIAYEVGMSVPLSKLICIDKNDNDFDSYPCIVKPLESIHGGKRVDVCKNFLELKNALCGYGKGDKVLVQQFIKRDYEIVIDGVALTNGDVVIPGYVRKHRDVKGGTAYATTYPISMLPQSLVRQVKLMVKTIGYEGMFGMEFIVCNDEYYFIEMNLRNDATTYALAVAGVNIPYIYRLFKLGKDYTVETKREVRKINAMMEIRDITFALNGKVSLWQWLKDLRGCECRYYYNKYDKAPYRKARNQYIKSQFEKLLKRMK
ncbi:MAG: ATP-grasp domain-containing protein [Bacteroidales bacterium]|nr:ATP-grasp domain-containing protein [Bacteroidales bacterium]